MVNAQFDDLKMKQNAVQKQPLLAAAVLIYATLGLLTIAIPHGVVNWVRDLRPSPVQDAGLEAAENVEAALSALGTNIPYRRARDWFMAATGKNE